MDLIEQEKIQNISWLFKVVFIFMQKFDKRMYTAVPKELKIV